MFQLLRILPKNPLLAISFHKNKRISRPRDVRRHYARLELVLKLVRPSILFEQLDLLWLNNFTGVAGIGDNELAHVYGIF